MSRYNSSDRTIYRDKQRSVIAGVAAGLADYFGSRPWTIRIIMIFLCLFPPLGVLLVVSYFFAAMKLPVRPDGGVSVEELHFSRSMNEAPAETFGGVRHRMRELEQRLRRMEAYVTSPDYEIDRGIRD